jgi:NTE family protein
MRNKSQSGRPRVGLALGAGGARGWAHVGVLRRLTALGVPVDCVAGTSIGALVGAVYLAGRLELLEDLASHLDWKQLARLFVEVSFPRSGIITGRNIERFLQEVVGVEKIEALDRPYAAVATDLHTHREVAFKRGNLIEAIRASISIPGIFTPAQCGKHRNLVDGALVNPLPVSVLRAMGAVQIIAVDINLRPGTGIEPPKSPADTEPETAAPERSKKADDLLQKLYKQLSQLSRSAGIEETIRKGANRSAEPSIFDVLTQSTRIIENQMTRNRLLTDPPDLLIQPAVGDIATLDFARAAPAIAAGEEAVDEKLPALQSLLEGLKNPSGREVRSAL